MNVDQEKQAQNQGYLKMVGYAHRIQVAMHYHPWTELWEGQVWSLDKVVYLPLGMCAHMSSLEKNRFRIRGDMLWLHTYSWKLLCKCFTEYIQNVTSCAN